MPRNEALCAPLALLWLTLALGACSGQEREARALQSAQQDIASGDLRTAAIELKSLLARNPDHTAARVLLGETHLAMNDPAGAVSEFERAVTLGAPRASVAMALARAHLMQRDYAAVLADMEAVADDDAAARTAVARLRGDAFIGLGRFEEARQAYASAVELDARDVAALRGLAGATYQVSGLEAALQVVDQALAVAPRDVRSWLTRARLHAKAGRLTETQALFETAYSMARESGSEDEQTLALAGVAEIQLTLGKSELAGKTLEQLTERAPNSGVARYLGARHAFLLGDYARARMLLEELLSYDPRNRQAQLLLGAVNYAQGNLEQADMYLASVLAAEPANAFARRLLADTRLRQARPDADLARLVPALTTSPGPSKVSIEELERDVAQHPGQSATKLDLATAYLTVGQPEKAVALLEGMEQTQSGPRRRELLLMAAHARHGDVRAAARVGEELAKRQTEDAVIATVVGGLMASLGELDEARMLFERARKLEATSPTPLVNLGRLELMQKNLGAAGNLFEEALRLSPRDTNAQLAMAALASARSDVTGATRWLERARADNPAAAQPRILLAEHFLSTGDVANARSLAEEAYAIAPENAATLNVLGVALARSGESEQALAQLREAARRAPDSAEYRFGVARGHLAAAQPEEALDAARASLELDPDYVPALALVAALAIEQRNVAEAERLLERLQQTAPQQPSTLLLEGDVAMLRRDFGRAAQAYAAAYRQRPSGEVAGRQYVALRQSRAPAPLQPLIDWVRRHPEDPQGHVRLAQAQQVSGMTQAALASYQAALEADGNNVIALNNAAWLCQQTGDTRALELATRAYDLAPKSTSVMDTYGWILLHSGQTERGLQLLRKANMQAPADNDIRYHLATALAESGNKTEARGLLEEALSSQGTFADRGPAQQLLDSLADGAPEPGA